VGVRLLTRTTRNVAPTEAGERMLRALGPALDAIAEAMASAVVSTTVTWAAELKGLASRRVRRPSLGCP
jgi:DNA-binding transcriptional LysR family regulator